MIARIKMAKFGLVFIVLNSISAEKILSNPPIFRVFDDQSCNAKLETVATIPIGPSRESSSLVQAELEKVFARRPEIGLVTCAPTSSHRLRLRSLLVLQFPLENNHKPILDVVQGDCGNPLFVYVAAHTNGPTLLRNSLNKFLKNSSTISLGENLWDHGWKIAMISCSHLDHKLSSTSISNDDNLWEKPLSIQDRPLHDLVEAHNTYLVEQKMRYLYPYVINQAKRPMKPRPINQFEFSGVTVIVMTYNNIENANNAKKILEKVVKIEYEGKFIVTEAILLWNSDKKQSFQPSITFLEDSMTNGRVVIAPTNDLQNRMNMKLIQPKTAAIMALDDDSPLPSAKIFGESYREWSLNQGISLQGLQDSRGAPITIKTASYHGSLFSPVYAYLGHPHCVQGRSWMVENPFIYHQDYAQAFSSQEHEKLHEFIKSQPSHPDDISFGTFVNWASESPAICIDEISNAYHPHPVEQQQKQQSHHAQVRYQVQQARLSQEKTSISSSRRLWSSSLSNKGSGKDADWIHGRRLGLSGGPEWLFLRSHGAMWVLFYFGGFHNPTGCWISARKTRSHLDLHSSSPKMKANETDFILDRQTFGDCVRKPH